MGFLTILHFNVRVLFACEIPIDCAQESSKRKASKKSGGFFMRFISVIVTVLSLCSSVYANKLVCEDTSTTTNTSSSQPAELPMVAPKGTHFECNCDVRVPEVGGVFQIIGMDQASIIHECIFQMGDPSCNLVQDKTTCAKNDEVAFTNPCCEGLHRSTVSDGEYYCAVPKPPEDCDDPYSDRCHNPVIVNPPDPQPER
jgi:hypothetical protein